MKIKSKHDQDMIYFLQRYLQIDTSHPQPNYTAVCKLFQNQALQDGFIFNIITTQSMRPIIVISYQGIDPRLPSLMLNHHMDVVPALNIHKWISPPFAGNIHENNIIGRGAQDTKGLGVVQYYALRELKKANISLKRSVHLVIVPDEEIGGFTGTKEFVATDFFKKLNVGYVIDEGIPSGQKNHIAIKISERKPLQIKITTAGLLAHGSKLNCFNAIHELIEILNEIVALHRAQQKKSISKKSGLLLSANITSLSAGTRFEEHETVNTIPESASATIDIRIPPSMSTDKVLKDIRKIIGQHKNTTYTVIAAVADSSLQDCHKTPLYFAFETAIAEYGLTSEPLFFEATTDLRFYRSMGIDGIGCSPFTTQDNIHGTNESIPVTDLIQAKNIMNHFLKKFCLP